MLGGRINLDYLSIVPMYYNGCKGNLRTAISIVRFKLNYTHTTTVTKAIPFRGICIYVQRKERSASLLSIQCERTSLAVSRSRASREK